MSNNTNIEHPPNDDSGEPKAEDRNGDEATNQSAPLLFREHHEMTYQKLRARHKPLIADIDKTIMSSAGRVFRVVQHRDYGRQDGIQLQSPITRATAGCSTDRDLHHNRVGQENTVKKLDKGASLSSPNVDMPMVLDKNDPWMRVTFNERRRSLYRAVKTRHEHCRAVSWARQIQANCGANALKELVQQVSPLIYHVPQLDHLTSSAWYSQYDVSLSYTVTLMNTYCTGECASEPCPYDACFQLCNCVFKCNCYVGRRRNHPCAHAHLVSMVYNSNDAEYDVPDSQQQKGGVREIFEGDDVTFNGMPVSSTTLARDADTGDVVYVVDCKKPRDETQRTTVNARKRAVDQKTQSLTLLLKRVDKIQHTGAAARPLLDDVKRNLEQLMSINEQPSSSSVKIGEHADESSVVPELKEAGEENDELLMDY